MSCFIIAEAGVNHNGDLDLARRLVDVAADAGADAVKFQTFRASEIASPAAPRARYQTAAVGEGGQQDMLRALELSEDDHVALSRHAAERGILFSSTAFDPQGVDLLERLDVPFLKIPSGEITNYPLIRHVTAKRRPVILSTGMSTLEEVRTAVGWLGDGPVAAGGLPALTVLHCVSAYPAPAEDINLRCVASLARDLDVPAGYSDHSLGIEIPIAAVALGARVIEKHFTVSRDLDGPDHRASLEPDELTRMVAGIRMVERALGDGRKRPAESEMENIGPVRRGIVARRPIGAGELFSEENLAVRRPAVGVSAAAWPSVIGRAAPRAFAENEPIEL
jgi:N-acetylneuraminate synthase